MDQRNNSGLERNQLGLLDVIMPGLAQVAPVFNLVFTTGVMAGLAGSAVPLVFLISMVGMTATANSLAQFSRLHPSAGSFLTYIAKAIGSRTAVTVGIITIFGYIIAFAGIYIFVGQYIVQNVLGDPKIWGITQIVTILYGILVLAPVIVGLKFGVRTSIVLYLFEVLIFLIVGFAVLFQGGAEGLSLKPFTTLGGEGGTKEVFVAFSLAILAFGGFEASASLAEETRNPRRNVPIAVFTTVIVSGILYVFGSYALVMSFGADNAAKLAADPNPFQTAATGFVSFVAPLVTWVFLSSVTSSYVAANTQTSRVIFGGARGGLWARNLAAVSPRFRTPWAAAVAFVVPSVLIGVASTAFTDPGTAAGFLGTYGILGLVIMYVMANVALIVQWFRYRSTGEHGNWFTWLAVPIVGVAVLAIPIWGDLQPGQPAPYSYLPWLTLALIAAGILYTLYLTIAKPNVLERAPALLEGAEEESSDEQELTTVD